MSDQDAKPKADGAESASTAGLGDAATMNRQERRKQQRIDAKEKRRIWPSGVVEIPLDECLMRSGIKDGDMFTIAGVKRHKNGVIVRDCKPGTETTWVAKLVSPNAEVTGAKPALSAERPATEGSEVERRVGGGCETGKPLFELHGPSGEHWTIYENGTYTGFPDGTWIVNRAITEMDLLRGRIKQLDGSLIADE